MNNAIVVVGLMCIVAGVFMVKIEMENAIDNNSQPCYNIDNTKN